MIDAIIPYKGGSQIKSRMGTLLTFRERYELARTMLSVVCQAAHQARSINNVWIVTGDRLDATGLGQWVKDPGDGLNAAIAAGIHKARMHGGGALLILPADLPLTSENDIDAFICDVTGADMGAVSDERCIGTNALYLSKAALINTVFGDNSFVNHKRVASAAGYTFKPVVSANISVDIDTIEDYMKYKDLIGRFAAPERCSA